MNFIEAVKAYIQAYDDFGDSCECHPVALIRRKSWDSKEVGLMESWGIARWIKPPDRDRPFLREGGGITFQDALAEDWELVSFPLGEPDHRRKK